ncbi:MULTISPECIES: hypothetical protein [Caballeronia]|uniref:hypothetical protein n=1 Tax=Caballeronia TaxID=1827195 RepID=UPI001177BA46|nr:MULTISPECIES: hypothetical protein [Caballeronia]MCE4542967.1 hypothetical protein [Caballeronia sp. PC1]MCE4567977.1 hypothetical protein [Caballeronia sp. CLC5]
MLDFRRSEAQAIDFQGFVLHIGSTTRQWRGAPSNGALFYNGPVNFGYERTLQEKRRQRTFRFTIAVSAFRQRPR